VERHHIWYPRDEYRTKLERRFRNLPLFVVSMESEAHKFLHIYNDPPRKPDKNLMAKMIQIYGR
jgi:hypothetical protein